MITGTRFDLRHNEDRSIMVIADDILESAHVTEAEVRSEVALSLFARERITLSQAARPANLPQVDFQSLLAARRIPIHYDVAELEEDLQARRLRYGLV